jgi:hypothetical protein
LSFFLLTFVYSYIVGLPLVTPILGISSIHLPSLAALGVQLLAAWAPTLTAVFLTYLGSELTGVRQLLARLTWWHVGIEWYIFVLLTPAAVIVAALGLHLLLGGSLPASIQLTSWSAPFLQFLTVAPMYARQDRPIRLTDLLIWLLAITIMLNPFGLRTLEDR